MECRGELRSILLDRVRETVGTSDTTDTAREYEPVITSCRAALQ